MFSCTYLLPAVTTESHVTKCLLTSVNDKEINLECDRNQTKQKKMRLKSIQIEQSIDSSSICDWEYKIHFKDELQINERSFNSDCHDR